MPKILLVDDEPDLVELLKSRLETNNYEVTIACDGQTCLEKAKTEAPDVILLDLVMPGIDGYEAGRRLKEMPETKDIPIILFTASYARSIEEKAKALGAFDCIVKPFDPELLLQKIARALNAKKQ
jgi:two-component system alkaline phosphatase synthesis response regulator PhoP